MIKYSVSGTAKKKSSETIKKIQIVWEYITLRSYKLRGNEGKKRKILAKRTRSEDKKLIASSLFLLAAETGRTFFGKTFENSALYADIISYTSAHVQGICTKFSLHIIAKILFNSYTDPPYCTLISIVLSVLMK